MWLARLSDHDKLAPCDIVFERIEWTCLTREMNKTRKSQGSVTTVDVEQAFLWIAKLGGYIARPSYPDTGVISLWRGWERLSQRVDDYRDICGSSQEDAGG